MTVSELVALGRDGTEERDREAFEEMGRGYAQQADVIALLEMRGTVDQVILLRDEAIAEVHTFTREAFRALSIPVERQRVKF